MSTNESVAAKVSTYGLSAKDRVLETGASVTQVSKEERSTSCFVNETKLLMHRLAVIRTSQANLRASQRVPRVRIRFETLRRSQSLLFAYITRSVSIALPVIHCKYTSL